jgi:hypothetical protein
MSTVHQSSQHNHPLRPLVPWCVMYRLLCALPLSTFSLSIPHTCLSISPTSHSLLHGSNFTISHTQSHHEHPSMSRSIPGTNHGFQCNGHCCCNDMCLGLCFGPQFHVTMCISVHKTSSNWTSRVDIFS